MLIQRQHFWATFGLIWRTLAVTQLASLLILYGLSRKTLTMLGYGTQDAWADVRDDLHSFEHTRNFNTLWP
jgi:hypothetical protein